MKSQLSSSTIGSTIVFSSVICMAASLVLAQRVGEKVKGGTATTQPPATATQPPATQPRNPGNQRPTDPGAQADRPAERPADRPDARRGDAADSQDAPRPQQLGLKFSGDDLIVTEVAPGSAAASAGFRAQDKIISVEGQPITGQRRLTAMLGGLAGERVPVVIDRGGRQFTVQLMTEAPGDRPWLGVYLQDNQENERGARITHIYPAGPAARAGLRTGDVIIGVNDQEIQASYDLIATIDALQPQSKVKLKVLRGEQELEAAATLAARDSFVFHSGQFGDRGQGYEGRQGFEGRDRGYSDDRFARDRGYSDDPFENLPPYAMQMEHDRRNAEQHERIEAEIRKLAEEVRMLREAIQRR